MELAKVNKEAEDSKQIKYFAFNIVYMVVIVLFLSVGIIPLLYYDYGLRVTINTDNRLVSDTTLTHEFYIVAKHLNLNLDDIKSMIMDGFKSAFLPNRAKSIMLNMVNDKLKKY